VAFLPEQTIPYKSYLKRSLVEGLKPVFTSHPDSMLQGTKVSIDFPNDREKYPAVLVRYHEATIFNSGVGHVEFLYDDQTLQTTKYKHFMYKGEAEFAVYALSSLDRDYISSTIVQTLAMGDLLSFTDQFQSRIYAPSYTTTPDAQWNFVNLNTDQISANGESQLPAPWQPEDVLVYMGGYRIPVWGEFYSLPPNTTLQNIAKVNIFPYMDPIEPVPTGTVDPAPWS
jgi:hypothetical protein